MGWCGRWAPSPRWRSRGAGVAGAASGAGLYIGTYFAFYGAACNVLTSATDLPAGAVAFLAGGAGAVVVTLVTPCDGDARAVGESVAMAA